MSTRILLVLVSVLTLAAAALSCTAPDPSQGADSKTTGMNMGSGVAPTPAAASAAGEAATPVKASTDAPMGGMDMGSGSASAATPVPAQQGMPGMETGAKPMADRPVPSQGVPQAVESEGGKPLPFKLDGKVKVFDLTAQPVLWKLNPETQVTAWTYNGTVPGPLFKVMEGDMVRVVFKNTLPDPTSIHWHGLKVPTNMDGVSQPPLSQKPVMPGETFTYEFEAKPAGTFMYHSHYDTDRQINTGLFGGFVIEPKSWAQAKPDVDVNMVLNEWRVVDGVTYPAMPAMGEPNYFAINGKTYPQIPTLTVKQGQRVRIRFAGAGQFTHPMHLHGMPFKIVATDGYPVPEGAQLTKDVVTVQPGERFDIEFVAESPGQWAFHCHIVHHVTNDDVEPGGLLFVVNVQPS